MTHQTETESTADKAAVTPPPALTTEGRLRARVQTLEEDAERNQGLAKVGARCMREGHQGLIESGRATVEGHRFALSVKLGLGTDATWDAIHERVKELRVDSAESAAVSAAVAPPTQAAPSLRAGLRDEIVKALGRITTVPPVAHRREQADHVLAVLYREWPWLRAEAEDDEPTDRAALRDRIAEALMQWAEGNNSPQYGAMRRPATVVQNAYSRADAVLAVLPEPTDQAPVLRWAADQLSMDWGGPDHEEGMDEARKQLRRMADETATRSDVGTEFARQADQPDEAGLAAWEGSLTDETATQTPFTPPAHYRRDDGVDCCVHAIPVGPGSCQACRELATNKPAGPTVVDQVVAALQAKAQALSVEAEEEMRRDLEEQAQVWHEAADLARRTAPPAPPSTPAESRKRR